MTSDFFKEDTPYNVRETDNVSTFDEETKLWEYAI